MLQCAGICEAHPRPHQGPGNTHSCPKQVRRGLHAGHGDVQHGSHCFLQDLVGTKLQSHVPAHQPHSQLILPCGVLTCGPPPLATTTTTAAPTPPACFVLLQAPQQQLSHSWQRCVKRSRSSCCSITQPGRCSCAQPVGHSCQQAGPAAAEPAFSSSSTNACAGACCRTGACIWQPSCRTGPRNSSCSCRPC